MHLSIVLNRLLFSINEGQVTDVEQAVIITNNNLMLHFSGYNNDLLVLKQWKVVLNRIMPSLLGLLENNDLALRARSLLLRRARSEGVILYLMHLSIVLNRFLFSILK